MAKVKEGLKRFARDAFISGMESEVTSRLKPQHKALYKKARSVAIVANRVHKEVKRSRARTKKKKR